MELKISLIKLVYSSDIQVKSSLRVRVKQRHMTFCTSIIREVILFTLYSIQTLHPEVARLLTYETQVYIQT